MSTKHLQCPLCKVDWKRPYRMASDNSADYYICGDECGMMRTGLWNLMKYVGPYVVYWFIANDPEQCVVCAISANSSIQLDIELESLLPFDVTEEQIRLYLTFY